MGTYKVIGYYRPKVWKCYIIGRDLTNLTKSLGLVPLRAQDSRYEGAPWSSTTLHAHVRRRTLRKVEGAQWHQDGDYGHITMKHALVLWSNRQPTEFRVSGIIYQPEPYEVVYFNNLDGFHRRPLNAERRRYIFRQRVATTGT